MADVFIEKETATEIIFVSYYEGTKVRFMMNKQTGEISICADDVCVVLGLGDSFKDFLGSDKGLDFINDWKKAHPGKELFGDAIIERTI